MNAADWGAEDWENFTWWGAGGRALLGYPAEDPTQILALRVLRPYHAPVRKMQPVIIQTEESSTSMTRASRNTSSGST